MTEHFPLVSIIIPLYNRAHTIRECIESCTTQTYEHLEIIVIDDFSTDNSVQEVEKLMALDSRIKLFRNNENQKLGFTRNVGIKHAKGELITFLDSDDLFLPEKLESVVIEYKKNPEVDCINSPVLTRYYNKPDEVAVIHPQSDIILDYLKRRIIWKIIGPVWTRQFLDKIGYFLTGERIFGSEDFEFHFRAIINAPRVIYLTEPLSIQVNLDPDLDKVKIRHADKLESRLQQRLYARSWVIKRISDSGLNPKKKMKYYWAIFYYFLSLMKSSLSSLPLKTNMKILKGGFRMFTSSSKLQDVQP